MAGIVVELQRDAVDRNVPVSDLLRKTLVVARKLKAVELREWIENEIGGYKEGANVPKYRHVTGRVKSFSPYHGWRPVLFEDPSEEQLLSARHLLTSVPEIEDILSRGADSGLHMPYHPEIQHRILEQFDYSDTQVTLNLQPSSLVRVIEAVRDTILNWSLSLEEQGILGEGLTFTVEEQQQARVHPQNVAHFYGTVHNPQFQQGSHHSVQVRDIVEPDLAAISALLGELRKEFDELHLSGDAKREAEAEIETLDVQLQSPRPKPAIIREALRSLRSIVESAGGSLAAHFGMEIGNLLG